MAEALWPGLVGVDNVLPPSQAAIASKRQLLRLAFAIDSCSRGKVMAWPTMGTSTALPVPSPSFGREQAGPLQRLPALPGHVNKGSRAGRPGLSTGPRNEDSVPEQIPSRPKTRRRRFRPPPRLRAHGAGRICTRSETNGSARLGTAAATVLNATAARRDRVSGTKATPRLSAVVCWFLPSSNLFCTFRGRSTVVGRLWRSFLSFFLSFSPISLAPRVPPLYEHDVRRHVFKGLPAYTGARWALPPHGQVDGM